MNSTNDNVPTGMSLRDWFAGMALSAHCSAALTPIAPPHSKTWL